MLKNARKFFKKHCTNQLLLKAAQVYLAIATTSLMVFIATYNPTKTAPAPQIIDEENQTSSSIVIYNEQLDDEILEAVEKSEFTLVKRTQTVKYVTFEVIEAKRWCQEETISLQATIKQIWESYGNKETVRIVTLNKHNNDLVDYIVEDEGVTWKR